MSSYPVDILINIMLRDKSDFIAYGLINLNYGFAVKHRLPPLDSLKAFESAARHLSFSIAADELCVTKGAISSRIRKLEEQIQCALFKRSVRQVYLTDAGQALLVTTQRLFQDLGDELARLQSENLQASVSIAVSTYVAARWLSSRVSRFSVLRPDITIVLQHSVNSADFKLGEVDLAIRWGPCNLRSDRSRLGEIPMSLFPVVSPSLLKRQGIDHSSPVTADLLLQTPFRELPLLCEDRTQDLWQEWFETNRAVADTKLENPRRIISDASVRVQAAVDGQGLILADDLMLTELNHGLLLAPFIEQLSGYGYVFMSSPTRIESNNARELKNWLIDHQGWCF